MKERSPLHLWRQAVQCFGCIRFTDAPTTRLAFDDFLLTPDGVFVPGYVCWLCPECASVYRSLSLSEQDDLCLGGLRSEAGA